ncbi:MULTISPECIES: tellurite resistance TerB family protein [Pseudomonas]|uniref:Tellurite resistance TerB family protein n=1 Tax=Pseudomonas sp. Hg7Tf TaxID=3236988 RepID=A0AB39I8S6_9PSED|nr:MULTISPECIES: tellurite resistance TerB family protein [unclassified Pseudomonas]KJK08151.1 Inner membrane protein yebE [Pseudomonas sp. 5]MDH2561974.1 tellurite resistance TerB family protein [Pseudomonas sp. Hg5Tf]QYX49110.1 tellurite resistance TerB family protein [Pseudomonas sp. S11A 273]
MNTSDLLEQLLRAGQGSRAQQGSGGMPSQDGLGGLGGLLGGLLGGGSATGGGDGLGGLLGGLLGGSGGSSTGGTTQGRPTGGTNYAALASLGMMAFQAYQSWQRSQAAAPQQAVRTVDQLSGPEAEDHSHAILSALIAAAKADGRIDKQEEQLIYAEIKRQTSDPQLQQWLDEEVSKPLDAAEVAQSAQDPAMAAEMYLASVMLVDDQQDAERAYLDELAGALQIDPTLQVHLEQQAKGAA